jgi:hypothetical protein
MLCLVSTRVNTNYGNAQRLRGVLIFVGRFNLRAHTIFRRHAYRR